MLLVLLLGQNKLSKPEARWPRMHAQYITHAVYAWLIL